MLWVYDQYQYFISSRAGTVFIRQILTNEDGPHTERIKAILVPYLDGYSLTCECCNPFSLLQWTKNCTITRYAIEKKNLME